LENGNLLVVERGGSIHEFDTKTRNLRRDRQILAHGVTEAWRLPNGHTLFVEDGKNRVCEVDEGLKEVWSCEVNAPVGVHRLKNGNTLIARAQGTLFEVSPDGNILWSKDNPDISVSRISFLDTGNYLVTDSAHHRVLELGRDWKVLWEKGELNYPSAAARLDTGNTLIVESGANRLVEVDRRGREVASRSETSGMSYVVVY
jgi:hypothetical protein